MNISTIILPVSILTFFICIHSANSATRPIRDFIDYNAREDGDHIISLPSNGPVPSFVLPPNTNKKPQVQKAIPDRGLFEVELRTRDESGPGGRRGYRKYSG